MANDPYVDYLTAMKAVRAFGIFGILPRWVPGTGDIEGFCHDEVVRQGHDPRSRADGGVRVQWLLNAWSYARTAAHDHDYPTLTDVLFIGSLVEPEENKNGFRRGAIWIGDERRGAEGVHERMVRLFDVAKEVEPVTGRGWYKGMTADEFYLEFEYIHPFGDGNGRTGKVLHNWLLGTLDDPVLVDDYFGHGNP